MPGSRAALMNTSDRPQGRFVSLDGPDGGGKTTQIARVVAWLRSQGLPVVTCRDPGDTPLGDRLRSILLDRSELEFGLRSEMLLFMASRAQLVREVIQPALDRGTVVLSDRFADSTTVYQGVARRLDQEMVGHLNTLAVGKCWPDLTFLLDIDVEPARTRMMRRVRPAAGIDRMEQEPRKFYEAVCLAYRELAAREPYRIQVIDAARPIREIEQEIWDVISMRFSLLAQMIPSPRRLRHS